MTVRYSDMPTSPIWGVPQAAQMTAPELGALLCLAQAYWDAGARPLPTDDVTLSVIARCHTRRWYDYRERILAAWAQLEPELARVYVASAKVAAAKRHMRDVAMRNLAIAWGKDVRRAVRRDAVGGGDAALTPKLKFSKENSGRVDHRGRNIPAIVTRGNRPNLRDSARV
jgi:uncharacterized protein YdaU (DUF1376 family)